MDHDQQTVTIGGDLRNKIAVFICAKAEYPIMVAADAETCPACGEPLPKHRLVEDLGK